MGIAPSDQSLTYHGTLLVDGDRSRADYGVKEQDVLQLQAPKTMRTFVKRAGEFEGRIFPQRGARDAHRRGHGDGA